MFRLLGAAALAAAFLFAVQPARAAEEPGGFNAPPVGTKFRYTDFSLQITRVEGREIEYHMLASGGGEDMVTQYGWFLNTDSFEPEVRGRRETNRTVIDRLWPLTVGKKVVTTARLDPDAFELTFEVIAAQDVTTPAGTFASYVVHAIERNATRPVTVERFLWYAPVIGGFVRGQQKVVRDGEILAERSYELLDIAENCLNSREGNPVPLRLAMERQGAL